LIRSIPILGLLVLGCACPPSLGPVVDDPAQRALLLQAYQRPDVSRAVFQTVVRWPGRELSLTEIVKRHADEGYSVVGVSDVGSTLYAARVAADGQGEVISKSLPFSDRWLLDGFVAELLIPWTGPAQTSTLHKRSDGTAALAQEEGRMRHVYLFDASGQWVGLQRLSGCRLRCQVSLEWGEGALPTTMRVENAQKHYRAVRENVSTE
jgi:hypothetical protein